MLVLSNQILDLQQQNIEILKRTAAGDNSAAVRISNTGRSSFANIAVSYANGMAKRKLDSARRQLIRFSSELKTEDVQVSNSNTQSILTNDSTENYQIIKNWLLSFLGIDEMLQFLNSNGITDPLFESILDSTLKQVVFGIYKERTTSSLTQALRSLGRTYIFSRLE